MSFFRASTNRVFETSALSTDVARALTVLGQHLNKRKPFVYPQFESDVKTVGESMEALAKNFGSPSAQETVVPPKIEIPPPGSIEADLIYSQLSKVTTEIEAMILEIKTTPEADS